jgi:quercetin dioxygenase-like cupin family protein
MRGTIPILGAIAIAAVAAHAKPAATPAPATDAQPMAAHPVKQLSDVKWGPGPDALPPGGELAVMSGDPGGKGFVSLRSRLPAGYKIAPHWHPTDEHVTVLSGTFLLGEGDTMDAEKAHVLNAGGYINAMANMHHYAIAKTAVVLQIDMIGPFEITYVNPADDPRKKNK